MLRLVRRAVKKTMMDEKRLIWLAGGTFEESRLILRFFGDDLEPDYLSQRLRAQPTSSCRKGDLRHGKDIRETTGRWLFECARNTIPVAENLDRMFGQLTADLTVWQELSRRYRADLRCHLITKRWNRGITLPRHSLASIADRGLELIIDAYFEGDSEPPV